MSRAWIITAFLSLLPVSELRGGIPYALVSGIPWYFAWPFAAAVNSLAAPLCWIFLSTLHKLLSRFNWYKNLFERIIVRARKKLEKGVAKWGVLGVALFVAIPLPMTGAWTGTLGAWVLGLTKRKTFPAVVLGVIAAGAVVTAVMVLGIGAFDFFVKKI